MSGSTIVSPNTFDTTLLTDNAVGAITAAFARQVGDSLSGLFTTQQAGNYTFALADRGTQVESTSASAVTFTVPPSGSVAFLLNTVIGFRQYGAGQITLVAGSGVTLRTSSSLTTRAQYSTGSVQLRAANEWVVSGDMT